MLRLQYLWIYGKELLEAKKETRKYYKCNKIEHFEELQNRTEDEEQKHTRRIR